MAESWVRAERGAGPSPAGLPPRPAHCVAAVAWQCLARPDTQGEGPKPGRLWMAGWAGCGLHPVEFQGRVHERGAHVRAPAPSLRARALPGALIPSQPTTSAEEAAGCMVQCSWK